MSYKILHIIPSLRKGGAERIVLDICRELQKREGVCVKLVVLHPENDYAFLTEGLDIALCSSKVIPSFLGKTQVNIKALENIIADYQPDIIHSHLFEAEFVSRFVHYPKAKWFSHCHDNMAQFRNLDIKTLFNKKLLTNFYEKRTLLARYMACDNHFIAISKDTEQYFNKVLPRKLRQNLTTLPNAIDYHRFASAYKEGDKLNSSLRFCTIGSLVDKKNQIFLVEVMNILRNKGLECRLDILGDGPNREKIQERINTLQLERNITLHGNVNKVEEFLFESTVCLHAATYEPFGLVLLEAMAAALPVGCLDGKGNRDLIEEGKNGYLLSKPNVEQFANRILQLIQSPELYQSMSQYAQEFAKRYDMEMYVNRLLELYR